MSTTDPLHKNLPPGEARILRRKERRVSRRNAQLKFLLRIAVAALLPAMIPAIPRGKAVDPAPAPAAPRVAERPPYDREPAEPAEGVSTIGIRVGR